MKRIEKGKNRRGSYILVLNNVKFFFIYKYSNLFLFAPGGDRTPDKVKGGVWRS